jgi:hypothetical protein
MQHAASVEQPVGKLEQLLLLLPPLAPAGPAAPVLQLLVELGFSGDGLFSLKMVE